MTELFHPKLSYKLVGILFEVHNNLGSGLREITYQKAIEETLKENKIDYIKESVVEIKISKNSNKKYLVDFIIAGKIVLEIKAKDRFSLNDNKQVFEYLKATGLKLGILANFVKNEVKYKRIINKNLN